MSLGIQVSGIPGVEDAVPDLLPGSLGVMPVAVHEAAAGDQDLSLLGDGNFRPGADPESMRITLPIAHCNAACRLGQAVSVVDRDVSRLCRGKELVRGGFRPDQDVPQLRVQCSLGEEVLELGRHQAHELWPEQVRILCHEPKAPADRNADAVDERPEEVADKSEDVAEGDHRKAGFPLMHRDHLVAVVHPVQDRLLREDTGLLLPGGAGGVKDELPAALDGIVCRLPPLHLREVPVHGTAHQLALLPVVAVEKVDAGLLDHGLRLLC